MSTQPTLFSDAADVCKSRHHGNPESEAAHASIVPSKAHMRQRVIECIERLGSATCDQVEVSTGLSHQTASARVSELRRDGIIAPTGERRPTRSGRSASVFVVLRGRADAAC